MSALRCHHPQAHWVGQFTRLVSALWFVSVVALQPALALSRLGPVGHTDSHFYTAKSTHLFASPVGRSTLLEQHTNECNPPSEKRSPECGAALAKSKDAIRMRFNSYLAAYTPHWQPLATGCGRAQAPRAPPFMHG